MTLQRQCEVWKTLALAYEVFIEAASEQDSEGMTAALKLVGRAKAELIAAGLKEENDDLEEPA
jgi:hypothetical protein